MSESIKPGILNNVEGNDSIEKELTFELGPCLGEMDYEHLINEVALENRKIGDNDEQWRVPTVFDWYDLFEEYFISKKNNRNNMDTEEQAEIVRKIKEKYGLDNIAYWTSRRNTAFSTSNPDFLIKLSKAKENAFGLSMLNPRGSFVGGFNDGANRKYSTILVRRKKNIK